MAAGVFTASLAAPYKIDQAEYGERQVARKSVTPILLVGAVDTACTGITTSYQQISSTFDLGNNPGAIFSLAWTYGAAAALLSIRIKASMDKGVLDPFTYVPDLGLPSSGSYVVDPATLTFAKATWDGGAGVAYMTVPLIETRKRYIQLWAIADSATTNTLAGYVGAGSRS